MAIEWREALSVGNDPIDADHKHLISLFNRTNALLSTKQPCNELIDVIAQLRKYTQDHFSREEYIMIAAGHPKYDQHKRAHNELIEQLRLCTQPIFEMGNQLPSSTEKLPKSIRDGLTGLLRFWLLEHVLKLDLQLKSLFVNRSKNYVP